jgi:hypothetical protein
MYVNISISVSICTLEDPGIDGKIILRWIFMKWDMGIWTGLTWLRIGAGGRHLRIQ